ncbi:MAG: class I SAM-dependent methyltransferase [Blautia sp.]|nr:class I SAM-dependent methyltransferase [Blautia sp.]MCM1199789.1 class I SAM-dependent methyltransferase [Bacteroides fragilis]
MREKIVLSDRLQAVASMVTEGNRVCDIGCDHGFVPIYLLQQGISPGALAMDVREGPLGQARVHIRAYGLEAFIGTRISDGLAAFQKGEADTLICAGMGGRLMMRILSEEEEKAASFRELILQPQSEVRHFRAFLRRQGYLLVDENMIEEDGKFYPMMKAVKKPHCSDESSKTIPQEDSYDSFWQRMRDRYGPLLLERKHPVLYRYLEREARICDEVLEQLREHETEEAGKRDRKSGRYEEISRQKQDCIRVMREGYGYGYGEDQD